MGVGLDSGLSAYPIVDPVIVSDITGNGTLSGLDAQRIALRAAGLNPPEIPPLPGPPQPSRQHESVDASQSRQTLDVGGVASYHPPTPGERVRTVIEHVRQSVQLNGEPLGVVIARKLMAAYLKRVPDARRLRGELMKVLSFAELEDLLEAFCTEHGF